MIGRGQMLGPYEIVGPIGAGGMGEVYQARDTRLDRFVAIKIMREGAGASEQALERFQREARAAAALNHPNVCAVYDVGVNPPFIAMELLEGETLHDRLTHGRLELSSMLDLALALADALMYAHAKGVVHRDVKPANVFLTARGPKILDFGLARTISDSATVVTVGGETRAANSPLTEPGVTVGTVAYMSPEQLRGGDLDARTDLFSAGLLLYEMATGRRAFSGDTGAAVAGAILHQQPVPPGRYCSDLPPRLDEIVLKALEKDRDDRYQTAADLRADLRRLKRELLPASSPAPGAGPIESQAGSSPRVNTPPAPSSDSQMVIALARRHTTGVATAAVALLLALAGGFYAVRHVGRSPDGPAPRAADFEVTQLTTSGNAERPAVSAAGNYVAYVQHTGHDYSLWVRQTASASNVLIVPPQNAIELFGATVTPDGSFVDYVRGEATAAFPELWRIPFLGGPPKRLIDNVTSLIGWSPDGRAMAFIRRDLSTGSQALVVADADGTHERVLATRKMPRGFADLAIYGRPSGRPAWSPDGRRLAVATFDLSAGGQSHVAVIDVATGAEEQVPLPGTGFGGLVWLSASSLVVSSSVTGVGPGALFRLSLPDGRTDRLTNDLNTYDTLSTAADGVMVTGRTERRVAIWAGDAGGTKGEDLVAPIPVEAGVMGYGIAWGGDRIIYTSTGGSISSIRVQGGEPQEIVKAGLWPGSTADGRTIVFSNSPKMWKTDADGGHRVAVGDWGMHPALTPDGRNVVFAALNGQTPWMVSIDGGEPVRVSDRMANGIDVSPDGKSIAFQSVDVQSQSVQVVCALPLCPSPRILRLSASGDSRVRWTPDGRGLVLADTANANLFIHALDTGSARQLTHFTDGRTIVDFAWSPDGSRIAVARATTTSDIVIFKGLK
jgi:serine/threonine protein kinase/Tol biopolymer transport system component